MDTFFYVTIMVAISLIYYGYVKKKESDIKMKELGIIEKKIELENNKVKLESSKLNSKQELEAKEEIK